MATTLQQIMDRFSFATQDASFTRWTAAERISWINEGYKQIVVLQPQATAETVLAPLEPGFRQRLDGDPINQDSAYQLLGVVANANGAAIQKHSRSALDGILPDWRRMARSRTIELFFYDDKHPREFQVYPPAAVGTQVFIEVNRMPAQHAPDAAFSDLLHIPDPFTTALLDYTLYRAYLKDADEQANAMRATGYFNAFLQGLGGKVQAETVTSPNMLT